MIKKQGCWIFWEKLVTNLVKNIVLEFTHSESRKDLTIAFWLSDASSQPSLPLTIFH